MIGTKDGEGCVLRPVELTRIGTERERRTTGRILFERSQHGPQVG